MTSSTAQLKYYRLVTIGLLILLLKSMACTPALQPTRQPMDQPIVRAVELDIGESQRVTLHDGSLATVTLLDVKELRDDLRQAVRRAEATVRVNGQTVTLGAGMYHRPITVAGVQIDCQVTKGNINERGNAWGLGKDARLRLWPAGSPLLAPGTFVYPARQQWFVSDTQMGNEPVFVDGGEVPEQKNIYYHYGLDFGGVEGMVEIVSATDGLVVSAGEETLQGDHPPVRPRYDVIYILDNRGWYYRYSHLKEIDTQIVPGARVKMGQKVGILGKEGGSGGWSHLHFDITSLQPSGQWGIQNGYAFIWEAYLREYQPDLIAVARPHHVAWAGDEVVLDGTKSWSQSGSIAHYHWTLSDGSTADSPTVTRTYDRPGTYSEILKVDNAEGATDYDFTVVQIIDRNHPDQVPPTINAAFYPTFDIGPGDEITFKVRSFRTDHGEEVWDFGDDTPEATVHSQGGDQHNPQGYAVTTHRYAQPGDYIATVERTNERGDKAVAHLHVRVGGGH